MKKKSIVKFACLGLPLLLAHATTPAQTVATLYGVLDVGVQYLSNANSAGKSQISLASGSFLPSRFGIKGQEDLGGGYNAFFLLESGFNVDDGSQASAATFFNRFSYIGLNTPYGAITLGRQGSVQYNKTYSYDPLYYATYSNLSLNAAPISILKINNAVQYQSKNFNGFNVQLEYGFGQELAGNSSAGRYVGGALEYVNDSFSARVLQERTRGSMIGTVDQSALEDHRSSIAATYKLNKLTFFGDFTRVTGNLRISPTGSIYTVAAAYSPSDVWRFTGEAGMYDQSGIGGRPKLYNAMVQYFFSKRTSLYAIAGYMVNSGGTRFGVAYPNTTALPDQHQFGTTLGMNHRF